jgi:hypothetical protein
MEPLIIDYEQVQEIKILNRKDSSSITIKDPVVIKDLLRNCLNGAMKEPIKFYPNYQLDISEIDTSYRIYINSSSVNRGGATYRSGCDVENTIRALFK